MEKKDIIILVLVIVMLALNFYLRQARKKKGVAGAQGINPEKKGGLSGQPDDYEPYSKNK